MDEVISVLPLLQRTTSPRYFQHLMRSTTCSTEMLTCTCLMPSVSFRTVHCSLQRLGWSGKSEGIAIKRRLRRRAKLPLHRVAALGLGDMRPYSRKDMPISACYIPGGNPSHP